VFDTSLLGGWCSSNLSHLFARHFGPGLRPRGHGTAPVFQGLRPFAASPLPSAGYAVGQRLVFDTSLLEHEKGPLVEEPPSFAEAVPSRVDERGRRQRFCADTQC